ncbi:FMN-binding negative transcriptional regulator [Pseudoalteromonas pernae]|uniref:FMN-binding negative transcriptional regulator n=1 Tax=Pseudoalteromonas pernae TaxID=3118054 RepID=UPI003242265D
MHIPRKFKQQNIEELIALMRQHPFANVIVHGSAGLEAHHLPLLLNETDGRYYLQGHIAKANPLWKNMVDGDNCLVVFNGPHSYISPNYYPTKAENGKAVPTWNYVAVHAKGAMRFVHDAAWIFNAIDSLTNEQERNQPKPWSITDAPRDYIDRMLPALVGINIEVSQLEGQWKLSQNQPEVNQQGVVTRLSELSEDGAQTVAKLVQQHAGVD